MKLISMTDFVLEQSQKIDDIHDNLSCAIAYKKIENYANLLKQPLTLGMFIPCDENGNVLDAYFYFKNGTVSEEKLKNHQKAIERVLFKDCKAYKVMLKSDYYAVEFNNTKIWLNHTNRIIEDLVQFDLFFSVSFEAIT